MHAHGHDPAGNGFHASASRRRDDGDRLQKACDTGDVLLISGSLTGLQRPRFWVNFEIRRAGKEDLLITLQ